MTERGISAEEYRAMQSERDFQRQVVDAAKRLGWMVFSVRQSAGAFGADGRKVSIVTSDGWPDLFLVRRNRAIAAELKSAKGKVSDEQAAWLEALAGAGIETHVWRPADWDAVLVALTREPGSRGER